MPNFGFISLFVVDPVASGTFYASLLDKPVVESAPDFVMLPISAEVMLGLWRRSDAEPKVTAPAGGSEIGLSVADEAEVERVHAAWKKRGLTIAQKPTAMAFGLTFVALDPDGHRLRVYTEMKR